jgi:hypothetical protein
MKTNIELLIVLLFSVNTAASLIGEGRGSAGISYDQSGFNTGIEGSYRATGVSYGNKLSAFLDLEKVFDDGREDAITGHSYQYKTDYFNALVDHEYESINPYLSWSSTGQYYYDIDSRNSNPEAWALVTGPRYIKRLRPDVLFELELNKSRQQDNTYVSSEDSGVIRLSKDINQRITIAGELEYYCTDYDDKDVIDTCSNEKSGEINSNIGATSYRLRLGEFEVHGESYPTYEVDFNHALNATNSFTIQYAKADNSVRNNILTRTESLTPDPATFTTTLSSQFLYDYKRLAFLIEMRASETESENQLIQEERYSTQADYRLAASQCLGCFIHLSFDRDNNETANWHSTSIGVDIPWIREFYNQIAIRYTNNDESGSFVSLIWILNYNGRRSILAR